MIVALPLLVAVQASDLPPLPEWPMLMALPLRNAPQITPTMSRFVADEYANARCPAPKAVDGRYQVRVDVAVLVTPEGAVRATIPHAIDCPTVEQYGAGLVTALARDNVVPRMAETDQWYRITLTFAWSG